MSADRRVLRRVASYIDYENRTVCGVLAPVMARAMTCRFPTVSACRRRLLGMTAPARGVGVARSEPKACGTVLPALFDTVNEVRADLQRFKSSQRALFLLSLLRSNLYSDTLHSNDRSIPIHHHGPDQVVSYH